MPALCVHGSHPPLSLELVEHHQWSAVRGNWRRKKNLVRIQSRRCAIIVDRNRHGLDHADVGRRPSCTAPESARAPGRQSNICCGSLRRWSPTGADASRDRVTGVTQYISNAARPAPARPRTELVMAGFPAPGPERRALGCGAAKRDARPSGGICTLAGLVPAATGATETKL